MHLFGSQIQKNQVLYTERNIKARGDFVPLARLRESAVGP